MTNKLQERLKEIAKEAGGNRALCEKSGVSERTFANWLSGSSEPKIIGISDVANAAGVTIDWLVSGAKPKLRLGARGCADNEMIQVALIDKNLERSNAPVVQRFFVKGHVPFSSEFLTANLGKSNFDDLCVLEVSGDSMEPTMGDGDFVLVDRNRNKIEDGLMAYAFRDVIYVKRLVNVGNGVEVISDNQSLYPPHVITGTDLQDLDVIGSVSWIGKTVL